MNKDIYVNDLMHRRPGHSFTETVKGDLTVVAFLDDADVEQASSTNEVVMDAYRNIRINVLGGEKPVFLLSQTERDALTELDQGVLIYNITTSRNECFNGTGWMNAAGGGMMLDSAYGEMYQDNDSGDTIPNSGEWNSASAGLFDTNGIITFSSNMMQIGENGAGIYAVSFNLNFTSSAGEICTAYLHVDGIDIEKVKDSHSGDSAKRGDLSGSGFLTLADGDDLQLHVQSESPTDTIKVYQVNLNIRRIS